MPQVVVLRLPVGKDPSVKANWEPEVLPALWAVDSVMFDPRNGVEFARAKILWGGTPDLWSSSGGGFAAEYGKLTIPLTDEEKYGTIGWRSDE